MNATLVLCVSVVFASGAFAQVAVTGAPGAKLSDLAGSPTLVTVILKATGAQDKNLKIVEIGDKYFTVESSSGEHNAYPFAAVREIKVQDGKVAAKEFRLEASKTLTEDEQKVVTRAKQRAEELFNEANNDQDIKMQAALLMTISGNEAGRDYLNTLAGTNDLKTRLAAVEQLYLADDTANAKAVLDAALASGDRKIKSAAAKLAGVIHYEAATQTLMGMVQDRSPDFMSSAGLALARLGNRDIIPVLLGALTGLDETKGTAASHALAVLGGPDLIEQMKLKLKSADGAARFRIIYVLFKLSDPLGRQLLIEDALKNPLQDTDAAVLLAQAGDNTGQRWLREKYFTRRAGTSADELEKRAVAAAALIASGDASAVTQFQELLRSEDPRVQAKACTEIGLLGKRNLVVITQATIESPNLTVALAGTRAAIAIANTEYRNRLLEWSY
ncbi:MAG: HEAT repeat domain-containing protein [Candidatus Hydrogenedentes bacterium]|nr:HEAT repeat domain-containing protein [Candidatus Hydrogenedentota bacterium]